MWIDDYLLDEEDHRNCQHLQQLASARGLSFSEQEIARRWADFSADYCAGWLSWNDEYVAAFMETLEEHDADVSL